jgi:RimJ/RimL family protein N-acetyltransferase
MSPPDPIVCIRPIRVDDVDALYEAVDESRDELSRWFGWCHPVYSREDTAAWLALAETACEVEREYSFAIEDEAGGLFGTCGLNRIDRVTQTANLGYWVRTSAAGRGVATSAARQTCAFAFREANLFRLEIVAAVSNGASQRVAEKLGAVREGILRKRSLVAGEREDAILYSILGPEFGAASASYSTDRA